MVTRRTSPTLAGCLKSSIFAREKREGSLRETPGAFVKSRSIPTARTWRARVWINTCASTTPRRASASPLRTPSNRSRPSSSTPTRQRLRRRASKNRQKRRNERLTSTTTTLARKRKPRRRRRRFASAPSPSTTPRRRRRRRRNPKNDATRRSIPYVQV